MAKPKAGSLPETMDTKGARLSNKTCLVTGASRGLGRAVARRFWSEGASLVLPARQPESVASLVADLPAHVEQRLVALPLDSQRPRQRDVIGAARDGLRRGRACRTRQQRGRLGPHRPRLGERRRRVGCRCHGGPRIARPDLRRRRALDGQAAGRADHQSVRWRSDRAAAPILGLRRCQGGAGAIQRDPCGRGEGARDNRQLRLTGRDGDGHARGRAARGRASGREKRSALPRRRSRTATGACRLRST